MPNRLKRVIVILLLIFILTPQAVAFADDPGKAAMPPISELFRELRGNKYLTTYRDNYYLDMGKFSFIREPEGVLNITANMLFVVQYLSAYLLVTIFYFSFEIDLYELFSTLVDSFIKEMEISLFRELSVVAICFLGIFFLVKLIQEQRTQIWVAILQTIIIVALSIQFFYSPLSLLKGIDEGSKYLSKAILAGTYRASNEGDDPNSAVAAAANDIWQIFVHKPWQILQFGNVEMAKKEEDRILSLRPQSKERNKIIEELAEDEVHFTPIWGAKRVGFMLMYFLPMLVMFVVIAILALLILAYQLLTIIYAIMGPFIFIMALIPFFGFKILKNWFMKIVGSGAIKAIVTLCMGLLFAFNSTLFKLMDAYGWMVVLILQLLVAVVLIWKRGALFETFTTLRLAPQNAQAINKKLRRSTNVESKMRDYSRNIKFRKNKGKKDDPAGSKIRSKRTGNEDKDSPSFEYEADDGSEAVYSGGGGGFQELYHEIQEDTNNDNENFRNLMKKAEEILEKQYEISKFVAEDKAEKHNKEPEYTPFVYKTMTREELGAPKFDQREILSVAKDLEKIVKAGGTPEDYYKKEIDQAAVTEDRPKSVIDIVVEGQKTSVDQDEAQKIMVEDKSQSFVDEFNGDYGTKYDQDFMKELIKEFGDHQVRLIMNRMKDIQKKDNSINNPAGYLTKSLKNNQRDKVGMRKASHENPFED